MKVGDTVYLLPDGNMTRRMTGSLIENIKEAKIEKVGKKLITVSLGYGEIKFRLDNKHKGGYAENTNYSCDYYMYESKQDILDMLEHDDLKNKISTNFSNYSRIDFSLDQLRRIMAIIEE